MLRKTIAMIALSSMFSSTHALSQETVTYSYDAKGRVTNVTRSGGPANGVATTFQYDAADNRQNVTVTGSGAGTSVDGATVPGAAFSFTTTTGYVAQIGGTGNIVGTAGFQDITALSVSGVMTFDSTFGSGNDIIRLSGNASEYTILQNGSSASLKKNATVTYVNIPITSTGVALAFADGVRKLYSVSGSPRIGSQTFNASEVQITAATDGTTLPTGVDVNATGQLILTPGMEARMSGNGFITGTAAGAETVHLLGGIIMLSNNFNAGSDNIVFPQNAPSYKAYKSGSLVYVFDTGGNFSIPIGTVGSNFKFPNGSNRLFIYDTATSSFKIGSQVITATTIAGAQQLSN